MEPHSSSARKGQHKPESYFYEELETAASQKQTCEVCWIDDSGKESLIISPVHDLYTDQGTEYVRLDNRVIPLNCITGVNGRRSSGQVDTGLLEKDLQPNAAPATDRHKYPEQEAIRQSRSQPVLGETSLLGQAAAAQSRPAASQEAVRQDESSDYVHRFSTTPPPFLIAENELYHFSADRLANRLYMKVKRPWNNPVQVQELSSSIERIALLMEGGFTWLNDLTSIQPDEEGTVWAPAIPNRTALFRNGLLKVADLVHPDCETLVHGPDSFSVNSVPLRYFKDRLQAEHWLTTERQDTDSINLSDHS